VKKPHANIPPARARRNAVQLGQFAGAQARGGGGAESGVSRTPTPARRACGIPHDSQVSPPRVLLRHPHHQVDDLGFQPLPASPRVPAVQRRATNSRCHRSSVAGVTRKTCQRSRGSSRANIANTSRPCGV
jgi:hypothetical protein